MQKLSFDSKFETPNNIETLNTNMCCFKILIFPHFHLTGYRTFTTFSTYGLSPVWVTGYFAILPWVLGASKGSVHFTLIHQLVELSTIGSKSISVCESQYDKMLAWIPKQQTGRDACPTRDDKLGLTLRWQMLAIDFLSEYYGNNTPSRY
jgi:hypothetical protein